MKLLSMLTSYRRKKDYRNVLLYDQWPDWKDYLVHTGAACSILLVGILGYVRLDRYLPRVVS